MSNSNDTEKGFTLIELLVVLVILGASAAIASPSLVNSWRQNEANRIFTQLVSALQQAQANANRMSINCIVTVNATEISAITSTGTSGCIQNRIISLTNPPALNWASRVALSSGNVTFEFDGTTTGTTDVTFTVARINGNGIADTANVNCVVVSGELGLIRTGKMNGSTCENIENSRYPN